MARGLLFVVLVGCGSTPHDPIPTQDLGAHDDLAAVSTDASAHDLSANVMDLAMPAIEPLVVGSGAYLVSRTIQNGLLYAYRIGLASTGLHIVSIDRDTGTLTKLVDDDASDPALDVMVDASHLYWIGSDSSSSGVTKVHRAALDGTNGSVFFDPSNILDHPLLSFPPNTVVQNLLVTPTNVFVVIGDYKTFLQVGTITDGGNAATYTAIASVTYPGETVIESESRGTIVEAGGTLYLAAYASFAPDSGASGTGFMAAIDESQKTTVTFGNDPSHIGPVTTDGIRVYWNTSTGNVKAIVVPGTSPGSVGVIPERTYAFTQAGGLLFGVDIAMGHAYTLTRTTPPATLDGSGTTVTVGSVQACTNADMQCLPYTPTIATDGANVYFTTPDGIYRSLL